MSRYLIAAERLSERHLAALGLIVGVIVGSVVALLW